MGIKDSSLDLFKKVAMGSGVALASTGLTNCNFGAVDPAPAPLNCQADGGATDLGATARIVGDELLVTISYTAPIGYSYGRFTDAQVTNLQGGALGKIDINGTNSTVVHIALGGDGDGGVLDGGAGPFTGMGSFTFTGTVAGGGSSTCTLVRTFLFNVVGGRPSVATRAPLPLEARHPAKIALVDKQGSTVRLAANTPFAGEHTIEWSVTGGETERQPSGELQWRLPDEPGLYQAELVIDYGIQGLAIDTMVFEVA